MESFFHANRALPSPTRWQRETTLLRKVARASSSFGMKKIIASRLERTVTSFSVWRKISLIDLRPLKYISLLEWNRLSNFYCFSFGFAKTYIDRIRNKVVHFVSICLIFKSRWKHELFKESFCNGYFINNSCLILFPSLSMCCSDHWTKKRDETRKKISRIGRFEYKRNRSSTPERASILINLWGGRLFHPFNIRIRYSSTTKSPLK